MRRRVALALIVLAAACGSPKPASVAPPNVLLISIDTLRADRLGCYGAVAVETPAIDRLAAGGVRFKHAFSPVPLTLPSHWTIHTGVQPWHHGVVDNGMVLRDPSIATLAERFSAAGYDTAAFIAAFVLNRAFGLDRGFGHYDDGPSGDAELDRLFHSTAPADERVGSALAWLRRPRSRPFFLWLHLYDPHSPYEPPPAFRALYPDRPYDSEVAFVDSQIARVLVHLQSSGLADRTLVVLLSDHGESLGEHGELTHGVLLYDATLHVPLVFRLPDRLPAGAVRSEAANLADVAPTVLALAGLETGAPSDGLDLFASAPSPSRTLGAISENPHRRLGWASLVAVREGDWKYIFGPRPELYRTTDDPREISDRLAGGADVARRLEREARKIAAATVQRAASRTVSEAGNEELARLAALGYIGGAPSTENRGANPKDAIGYLAGLDRASQLLASGLLDEADRSFRAFLDSGTPPIAALEGLGRIARMQGRTADAEHYFTRLAELDPESLTARAQLVVLARERGDLSTAIEQARRLVVAAPHSGSASRLLAEALLAAGRGGEAESEWRRGLALAPRSGWLRFGLARYLAASARPREAAAELDRILADEELPAELLTQAQAIREDLRPGD